MFATILSTRTRLFTDPSFCPEFFPERRLSVERYSFSESAISGRNTSKFGQSGLMDKDGVLQLILFYL